MVLNESQISQTWVSESEALGLAMLWFLETARRRGIAGPPTPILLSYRPETAARSARILAVLRSAGLVVIRDERWQLSRPGDCITVGEARRATGEGKSRPDPLPSADMASVHALLGAAVDMLIDRLTIGELTDLGDPAETSAGGEVPETTIDHVADRAGVSRSTVSRVLSGSSKVDARTRAKVEGAIVSLGYRPSVHARELARTAHRQDSARSPRT